MEEIDINYLVNEIYALMGLVKERTIRKYATEDNKPIPGLKMENKDITYAIMGLSNIIQDLIIIGNAILNDDSGVYYIQFEYEANDMNFTVDEYINQMVRFIKSAAIFVKHLS
jgi:hypothetical protein